MTKFPTADQQRSLQAIGGGGGGGGGALAAEEAPQPHPFMTPNLVGIPGGVAFVFHTVLGEMVLPVAAADAKALGATLSSAEFHK